VELTKGSIKGILLDLEVEGAQSLFVLLADDGAVNRLGTGTVDNDERDLFIGLAEEPMFEQLRDKFQPEWMSRDGEYDVVDKEGRTCTLTIIVTFDGGRELSWRFRYGSESNGPPDDICEFVAAAVRLTEPWYQDQKLIAASGPRTSKPWWKFWR